MQPDLTSLNGTFLNARPMAKAAPVTLKDGDVLSFGAKGNYVGHKDTSMIIGVREGEEYQVVRVPIGRGDVFVCFIDGVDEASDKPPLESGQPYGRRRVEAVLVEAGREGLGAQDIVQAIHRDLESFRAQQHDQVISAGMGLYRGLFYFLRQSTVE